MDCLLILNSKTLLHSLKGSGWKLPHPEASGWRWESAKGLSHDHRGRLNEKNSYEIISRFFPRKIYGIDELMSLLEKKESQAWVLRNLNHWPYYQISIDKVSFCKKWQAAFRDEIIEKCLIKTPCGQMSKLTL